MAEVLLKNVEKVYPNGFKAVHGVDLAIKDGEFMVFVGPSGCAKTTTLRMVAGLEEISGGEVWIGDRMVNKTPPKDRGIAMVFQNYALYPHMTVYENMAFGLKMAKVAADEIDRRVQDAARKLDITDLLERKPKEMSGGQRQRVAVGRAIVREPDVFLFDEPLSNLDAKLRVSMRVRITQLHKELKKAGQSATMIYVTHDQVEAMTMGDRICVMDYGKIMQVDTPLNLYHAPVNKFVAGFIGSPAMNISEATVISKEGQVFINLHGEELLLPEAKAAVAKAYAGKKVWFGIRPENINVTGTNGSTITGEVSVVEQMGNEVYIYFVLGQQQFIARTSTESDIRDIKTLEYGTPSRFFANMDKCHIFDYDTERNIFL